MTNTTATMRLHSPKMVRDVEDLCRIIPEGSIGVEIGSFIGESAEIFAKSGKFKRLYCVDPWQPGYYRKHDMQEIERAFDERTAPYSCITKVKATSAEAVSMLRAEDVNFVYIDGNHKYDFVRKDIAIWLDVLRDSDTALERILAGHDYKFPKAPGVEKAVKELLSFPDIRFAGYSWVKFIDRL